MTYRVLIVVKDKWYSDGRKHATFAAALRHRKGIAARWNTSDTAIEAQDGRVLGFRESLDFERKIKAETAMGTPHARHTSARMD